MEQLTIVAGDAKDWEIQTWNEGALAPASYQPGDTLTGAYLYRNRSTTPVFQPTVQWFTNGNTQTGYQQGQLLVSVTNAQAALLQPTVGYTLVVKLSPATDPSRSYAIVRLPVDVKAVTF